MQTRIVGKMCHNIITKSAYCDNETHGEYRKVTCKNMWFKPWNKIVKCKNQRDLRDELAVECNLCKIEGPKPAVEPWNTVCSTLPAERPNFSREPSPEPWSWEENAGQNTSEEGSEEAADTDTDISLPELLKEEPGEPMEPEEPQKSSV